MATSVNYQGANKNAIARSSLRHCVAENLRQTHLNISRKWAIVVRGEKAGQLNSATGLP